MYNMHAQRCRVAKTWASCDRALQCHLYSAPHRTANRPIDLLSWTLDAHRSMRSTLTDARNTGLVCTVSRW